MRVERHIESDRVDVEDRGAIGDPANNTKHGEGRSRRLSPRPTFSLRNFAVPRRGRAAEETSVKYSPRKHPLLRKTTSKSATSTPWEGPVLPFPSPIMMRCFVDLSSEARTCASSTSAASSTSTTPHRASASTASWMAAPVVVHPMTRAPRTRWRSFCSWSSDSSRA